MPEPIFPLGGHHQLAFMNASLRHHHSHHAFCELLDRRGRQDWNSLSRLGQFAVNFFIGGLPHAFRLTFIGLPLFLTFVVHFQEHLGQVERSID